MQDVRRSGYQEDLSLITWDPDIHSLISWSPDSRIPQLPDTQARSGFTLIELLIAISISVILMGAVFFSLTAALESWTYARNELALQQVMSGMLEEIHEGTDWRPGIRSTLELTRAWERQVSFVSPWVEEHRALGGSESFQLRQHVKPGAGLPVGELRLPDAKTIRAVPFRWEDPDNLTRRPRVRPGFELVSGSMVTLSYYPDPKRVPEAITTLRWDEEDQALYWETIDGREKLGENPFGVAISDFRLKFHDSSNTPLVENGAIPSKDLPAITAVEMEMTGSLGSHSLTLVGMVMLRNSMRHSGLVILREGLRVSVPTSSQVHTLALTNLIGINHDDEIELELRPRSGRAWRVKVRFERFGEVQPVIAEVTVEYPPGHPVFTDRPRMGVVPGLDLLTLGPNGLYDYDDDPDVDDVVLVTGEPVQMTVTRMDVRGAACFVQP